MNPQDDPEERIRQLEQATGGDRATELGVGQPAPNYGYVPPTQSDSYLPPTIPTEAASYPPPPPPPTQPWSYPPPVDNGGFNQSPGYLGTPFPTPQRTSSNRWMLFIPILIGMIALAGGVIFYVSNMFHGIGSITSNPGAGFTSAFPSIPTIRPTLPSTDPAVPAEPTVPAQGAAISESGIGDTKTIACNDSTVTLSGSQNNFTITGHCASVNVSGIDNTVTVDSADEITASGFDNHVVFHTGSPNINNYGSNTVGQG